MKKILLSVLALSMAIIWTSVLSYPQAAQAYLSQTETTEFKDIKHLPNGYRLGVLGIGQLSRNLPNTYMSVNAAVQVVKTNNKSKSQLKTVKVSYMVFGYQIAGSNLQNIVKNFNETLTASCGDLGYNHCSLSTGKVLQGVILYPSVQLKIDMTFTDGSYTVYSAKQRIY